ncbi:hypothetical protein [Streptomyces sp. NPDC050507]|uniref:hypothetical protein n=1 Tax=Streptomyces sp. NPDC050507 TaxID=3365619 RepID=UPI0037B12844
MFFLVMPAIWIVSALTGGRGAAAALRAGSITVPVRLTVTSARSGDTVVEDSTRAALKEQHPNGASCSPTAWTATFRAHPDKGLISPEGMKLR